MATWGCGVLRNVFSRSGGVALLQPSRAQRAGPCPEEASPGKVVAARHPACQDGPGGGALEGEVRTVVPQARVGGCSPDARTGLDPDGDFRSLPDGALASPPHQQPGGFAVRGAVAGMDANRFKKVSNATAVFWRKLLVAEKRFRRLHETEFLQIGRAS